MSATTPRWASHHTATTWWVPSAWAVGGVLVGALTARFHHGRRPRSRQPAPAAQG